MAVRKIKGSWWVDVRVRGVRYRRKSPVNDRSSARDYERRVHEELERREATPAMLRGGERKEIRFESFARAWIKTYVAANTRPSTRRGYESLIQVHLTPRFGGLRLDEIGGVAIEKFKVSLAQDGRTPKTINNALGVLKRCLACAEEWGLLHAAPRIRLAKVPPAKFDYLTPGESRQLLAAEDRPRWRLFFLCALRTGLRSGELIGLRWEDVDLNEGLVHVRRSIVRGTEGPPKSNRFRQVPLADDLLDALAGVRRESGPVFTNRTGDPLSWDACRNALRRACRRAGLRNIGLHALRHTFASQLARQNVSLLFIQGFLGHSTMQMTQRYAHVPTAALRHVVQVLPAAELATLTDGVGTKTVEGGHQAIAAQSSISLEMSDSLARINEKHPLRTDVFHGRADGN